MNIYSLVRQKGGDNMPRFDGTGPMGTGPMTGKGFGLCAAHFGLWKRFNFGRRFSRFLGWTQQETMSDEVEILREYIKALDKERQEVENILDEILKQK